MGIEDNCPLKELMLGSGGGGSEGAAHTFSAGGSGGGVLKIECGKLVFKGKRCVLSASGSSNGSGGALWLKCLSFVCKKDGCKMVNRGGIVRIDCSDAKDQNEFERVVRCHNLSFGSI